ncbi:MAG: ArnT family glycosyltransferase [Actinomycetota bacterium]
MLRLPRREGRWLLAILAVGTVLRVAWIVYAAREPQTLIDPSLYSLYAERIADGHGYTLPSGEPTAYFPPGYPMALGALVWLVRGLPGGYHLPTVVALFNLVLGVATIYLLFEVTRRVFDDLRLGLVAAAVLALWPNVIFHTAVALTETLFNFLLLAALLLVVSRPWDERPGVRRLVVFGLVLGASVMVRPISVLVLPALAWVWVRHTDWGWRWAASRIAIAGVATVAVVVPWTVRNTRAMDEPVLISTNFGDNLCMGRFEGAKGGFSLTPECFAGFDHLERPEFETRRNRETTERAIEYMLDHPIDELRLVWWRFFRTVENDHDAVRAAESYEGDEFMSDQWRDVWNWSADAYFFAVAGLAMVGVAVAERRADPRRAVLLWTAVAVGVPPLVFFGDPRFKLPVVPFMAIAAALPLAKLVRSGSKSDPQRTNFE